MGLLLRNKYYRFKLFILFVISVFFFLHYIYIMSETEIVHKQEKAKRISSPAQLEHLARIRELALEKKKKMKEETEKANIAKSYEKIEKEKVKKDLVEKYDKEIAPKLAQQEVKTNEPDGPEFIEEVVEVKPKQKKKVIRKIIKEVSESEEEEIIEEVHIKPKPKPKTIQKSIGEIMQETAEERMIKRIVDERTKNVISSIMPKYQ